MNKRRTLTLSIGDPMEFRIAVGDRTPGLAESSGLGETIILGDGV